MFVFGKIVIPGESDRHVRHLIVGLTNGRFQHFRDNPVAERPTHTLTTTRG